MKAKRPAVVRQTTAPKPALLEKQWVPVAALGLVVLIAYANSFGAGLAFDSRGLVLDDARVHEWSAENLAQIWRHTYWWPVGESGLYRPFTTLSYLINYTLLGNGGAPAGYHAINFLLHAVNVMLVWLLARRFWSDRWPPAMITAVWAVHPILTESVTNVAGRADLLAGASLLGGFLFYLKSKDNWRWLGPLMLITMAGVFSKESAVTIASVIIFYEFTCGTKDKVRMALMGCIAVAPPILFMLYQRSAVLATSAPSEFPFTDNPLIGASLWSAKVGAMNIVGRYIGLLLWPATLSCDYSYAAIPLLGGPWEWLAIVAAVALVVWMKSRTALFLAGSALLVFLPSSNLIFPIGTMMAERFLYLPAIAFAAAVVWGVYKFQPRHAPLILGLVVAALALRTLARNADWQDDLALSTSAVQACPASFKTHKIRANALLEADPNHGNLDLVIEEAEKSLAILDSLPPARSNFDTYERAAGYYAMKGDQLRQAGPDGGRVAYTRALELYRRALPMARQPAPNVHQQIARLCVKLGLQSEALDAARRARDLDPKNPAAHRTLAGVLLDAGRDEDAVSALLAGFLITRDEGLKQQLFRLYQAGLDPAGCAITAAGELNRSCATVQRSLCAAAADIVRLRPDLAGELGKNACR